VSGFRTPYEAGYNCGMHGANLTNCHFRFFSNVDDKDMWESGKCDAEQFKTITEKKK
jgi:hypothetical protein